MEKIYFVESDERCGVFDVLKLKDLSELAESFSQFELEYRMFDKKIAGVKFWQYIRGDIYDSHLRVVYGFFSEDCLKKMIYKEDETVYKLWDVVKEKVLYNQFFIGRRDVLIFESVRKVIDGNYKYRDVYTDIIDKKLKQSHYLLDFVGDKVFPQTSPNLVYAKFEQFKKVMRIKDEDVKVSEGEFESKVIRPIENYYNIHIDSNHRRQIFAKLQKRLSDRKNLARYYNYILEKSRPKVILIVGVRFEMAVLCAVAKKKNIPVVVLQHGTITTTEPTYNSKEKVNICAYPDYIFVFSKLEKKRGKFLIPFSRVIPVGYPELDEYIKKTKYKKSENGIKEILVLSCVDERLLKFTNELADKIDGTRYRIVYKLHPTEYGNWKNVYGQYLLHSNIDVVGNKNKIVYDYFMQAEWVIGMQSTAIYEATAFNVKIAIIDSPYRKDYVELFEMERANLIGNVDDFLSIIDRSDINSEASTICFERDSMDNVQKAIDNIIASKSKI